MREKIKFMVGSDPYSELKGLTIFVGGSGYTRLLTKVECESLAGMLTQSPSKSSESDSFSVGSSFSCRSEQIEPPKSIRRGKVSGRLKPHK